MTTHMHSYGNQNTHSTYVDAKGTSGVGVANGSGNGNANGNGNSGAVKSVTVNLNGQPLSQQSHQSQHSQQSQKPHQSQSFSPSMTSAADESMAILSPPASRYAFDPNMSGASFSQSDGSVGTASAGIQSHQVSPINDLNFASSSLMSSPQPYGQGNDIPAFDSLLEQKLENFTNDLQSFNNWIKSLNNEQKKTAIGMFIESVDDTDVLEFIKNKLTSVEPIAETKKFTFSPPLSANTNNSLPFHLRPVSPIIPMSTSISQNQSEIDDVEVPLTLDSILNQNEEDDNSSLLHNPEPKRVVSPPTIKNNTYLNNLINSDSPCERPKSAGPIYNFNSYNGLMSPILPTTVTGMESVSGLTNNGDFSLDAKLQHSLNTINSRTMLESSSSNVNNNEERGRRKFLQNRNGNSMNNLSQINGLQGISNAMNIMNMNNMNMPNMGMNMMNMNMSGFNMGYNNNSSSMANMMNTIGYNNNSSNNSNNNNNSNSPNTSAYTNIASTTTTNSNSLASSTYHSQHGSHGVHSSYNTHGLNGHASQGPYGAHSNFKHLKTQHTQSSSVPPNNRIRSANAGTTTTTSVSNGNNSGVNTTKKKGISANCNNSNNNAATSVAKDDSSNLPKEIAADSLLNDIPSWLKALRLHKYTENSQHLTWEEMVCSDDAALEKAGVSTVGARNKLLKSFKYVREQRGV